MVDKVDIIVDTVNDYTVDRKTAAERLKISVRTLDRHIKQGKLSTQQRDGRIWLSKNEIEQKGGGQKVDKVDTVDTSVSIDADVSTSENSVDMVSTSMSTSKHEEKIFKKLYTDLKGEFRHQQDRLEHANYRVGQLEAQLQSTVPLLEHNTKMLGHKEDKEVLNQEIKTVKGEISTLQRQLKNEQLTKIVYLAILFIILILQPVWLWLSVMK